MGQEESARAIETRLSQALDQQRAATLEQIREACRMYAARIEGTFAAYCEARVAELRGELRRELGDRFNQSLRRIRNSGTESELYLNLLEAAAALAPQSVLLRVDGANLRSSWPHGQVQISLAAAPALLSAIESRDTTVAARSPAELSAPLADLFVEEREGKIGLFPVVAGGKTVAVLCAGSGGADLEIGALELIAGMAGVILESRAAPATQSPLVTITAASPPESDQEVHSRARRFARAQVAEMRLRRTAAVSEGRSRRNLYSTLRREIDAARDAFRTNFSESCASMKDYLHLELVRTLGNDDVDLLGSEYPGPLQGR